MASTGYLIGVDVGGTFTDVVVHGDGRIATAKAFTTPGHEAQGVFDALGKAASDRGGRLEELLGWTRRFVHGSTVAANALLEKRGARTGFVSTEGFRDTLVMRRMLRENMYDLHARIPESILRRQWMLEAPERVDRDGTVVRALTGEAVAAIVRRLGELELESVGISFLFSFRNPAHERLLRDALRESLPGLFVVASSDVAPEVRDYERASTTALSAYLGPRVATYLVDLERRLAEAGLACELQVMRSNGGVCTVAEAVTQPVDMLLSGPAGGVVGAVSAESFRRERDVISFDMGGTSCDISVARSGRVTTSSYLPRHTRFEGWDVLRPFLDIHALGAGGGSVAWLDRAGGLHVGPRSAGAVPGPACYGRGGEEPTVTDAALQLGYLNPAYFLGHELTLDAGAAEHALARIAEPLGFDSTETASGIFRIVNAAMADGIRVVLADKGYDARDFTLLCFGGAGGVHAPALLAELGIRRLVIPHEAPAFSALGLLLSDIRYDFVRTVLEDLVTTDAAEIEAGLASMLAEARERLAASASGNGTSFERSADMRYRGQTHELRVPLPARIGVVGGVREAFEEAYAASFGYLNEASLIQLVNLRLAATGVTPKPAAVPEEEADGDPSAASKGMRRAFFEEVGGPLEAPILDGELLRPGNELTGPAIVEFPSTTIVVRPGQRMALDAFRNVVVEAEEEP